MPNAAAKKRGPIPKWAWIFASACFAIPVVALGGLIPGALGGVAGGLCLDIARKTGTTVRTRAIRCGAVVAASWIAFLIFAGLFHNLFASKGDDGVTVTSKTLDSSGREVVTVTRQARSAQTDLGDEAVRRQIYAKATRMRGSFEDAKDRLSDARASGQDTKFEETQLAHIQEMYQFDLQFTMKFHRISQEQLDAVLAEGDRAGWRKD